MTNDQNEAVEMCIGSNSYCEIHFTPDVHMTETEYDIFHRN